MKGLRLAACLLLLQCASAAPSTLSVVFPSGPEHQGNFTGRILVFLNANTSAPAEPRTQCGDQQDTAQVFGMDVEDVAPGTTVTLTPDATRGYPLATVAELPEGLPLAMQAEFRVYSLYKRGDGHNLLLPTSCVNVVGLNGAYESPVGTLYSNVVVTKVPVSKPLELSRIIPKKPGPGCAGNGQANSKWIKTVSVKSTLLSRFWGRDMQLDACVLLPAGFDENPTAKYPLVISHGHFGDEWNAGGAFRTTPPEPSAEGYDKVSQQAAYDLFREWSSLDESSVFHKRRALVITIKHPVPFFDDSYAVNSANVGPYGDAIMHELLPAIERQYRGVAKGWARAAMGGSTGGWESFAVQIFYPEEFNGAHSACPDPVSFTSYGTLDIYNSRNAYYYDSAFKKTQRPAYRDGYSGTAVDSKGNPTFGHPYGNIIATFRETNHMELAKGTHSRSCGQWDIWEAVFGPVGPDGFPARLYDKETGAMNPKVAEYWRENFDLLHILKRDWATLGPKLVGKLNLYVGNSDSFYLNDAVYDMQAFLSSTVNPYYNGSVTVGVTSEGHGMEHCFSGYEYDKKTGKVLPNSVTRLTYLQRMLPKMVDRWVASAPAGADFSWRY